MAALRQIDRERDDQFYLNPQSPRLHDVSYDVLTPLNPHKARCASSLSFYDSTDVIESEINPPQVDGSAASRSSEKRRRVLYWLQVTVTVLMIVLVALSWAYFSYWYEWTESYFALLRAEHAWFAPICYIGICYVSIQLLFPQTLLTLCGGFIFSKMQGLKGIVTSVGVVWCGSALGATQSFLNCRYVYQRSECIRRALGQYPDYDRISTALQEEVVGESLIVTMRIIPWTPYNVFNLSMATTDLPLSHFILGHLGMVPQIAMYCFFGAFLDSLARVLNHDHGPDSAVEMLAETLIWSLVSFAVIIYLGRVAVDKYERTLNEAMRYSAIKMLTCTHSRRSLRSMRSIDDEELDSDVSLL